MDTIHTASSSSSGSAAGRFRTCCILGIGGRCFLFRKVGNKLIGSDVSVISVRRAQPTSLHLSPCAPRLRPSMYD